MKSHFRILNCIRLIKFLLMEPLHLCSIPEESENIFPGFFFPHCLSLFLELSVNLIFLALFCISDPETVYFTFSYIPLQNSIVLGM